MVFVMPLSMVLFSFLIALVICAVVIYICEKAPREQHLQVNKSEREVLLIVLDEFRTRNPEMLNVLGVDDMYSRISKLKFGETNAA